MWCAKCNNSIPDCTCPDIEERLAKLVENPVIAIAVQQNIKARELKKQRSISKEETNS